MIAHERRGAILRTGFPVGRAFCELLDAAARGAFIRASTLLLCASAGALPVAAQDVEVRARAGVRLPDAYYARIRADADFFEIDRGWIERSRLAAAAQVAVEGTLPLVVVQALFADSPEPFIESAEIQRILFDGPTPFGTLTQFYQEVSGGRLTV